MSWRLDAKNAHAQIAQLVEQGTENPCVAGSIPALGTINSPLFPLNPKCGIY